MGDILKEAIADAKNSKRNCIRKCKDGIRRSIHTSNQIYAFCKVKERR